jgi:2-keto-4-pentenoate hydratase/2-oxohepta-3-ene-1,7-dioic acid hydratase in catechol pathway
MLPVDGASPVFGPCRLMDFELEVGTFIGGPPTNLGDTIPASKAYDYIFGMVLMNDWSGMLEIRKIIIYMFQYSQMLSCFQFSVVVVYE